MKNTRILLSLVLGSLLTACGGSESSTNEGAESLALTSLSYRGVSLAGAEFGVDAYGNGPLPGTFATNYIYPDSAYVNGYSSPDYYLAKGMNTFRVPFRWERLQPTRNAPFAAAELTRLTTTVSHLTAKGATVLLDPHNYARYGTALIGSPTVPNADFADLWSRLASVFKGNAHVLFGLMNEPHDLATEQWASAANAAIAAIRQAGATNKILVPGNGWTGAESWSQSWYGTPNATVMLTIQDPGNNFAFEAHQYLDTAGGTNPACVSATIGSQRMQAFTTWLRANGKKGFLGEFGAGSSPTCLAAIDDIVHHVETNSDVYLGWTYWAGGPWWGSNWMMLEPTGAVDVAQMTTLLPHLTAAVPAPKATCSDGSKNGSETGVDCGGSCPACPVSCQPTSYAAATMYHSIGGAIAGGWSVWSNGYVSTSHTVTAGQTSITVTAGGTVGAGVWPHMVVSIDGAPIGSAFVSSPGWADYAFPLAALPGVHQIRVTFDNDYASSIEDRNLFVAKVVVGCGAGGGACVPTTCAASGKTCGSTSDGCGGTLPCGTCTLPATCAGAGVANVCGVAPAQPPPGGAIRIMPLGDSITLGVNGGYRNGLWTRLLTAGKTIDFVGSQLDQYAVTPDKDHEGHPGFSIGNIAASTDGWLQSATPAYVLLMIGTNDVAWWCAQSASQVADQNAALIDQILADLPNAWVVVASIPPLSSSIIQPNNVDRAQLGKDYNTELQIRAQARIQAGKKVRFADVYSVLTVSDLYDGVHPTQVAADKVAQVWFNALTPILP